MPTSSATRLERGDLFGERRVIRRHLQRGFVLRHLRQLHQEIAASALEAQPRIDAARLASVATGGIQSSRARSDISSIRRLYIIRNGRVAPEFKTVKGSTLTIAGRSISTLIKTQAIGDLYQMYELARSNHVYLNGSSQESIYRTGIVPHPTSDAWRREARRRKVPRRDRLG